MPKQKMSREEMFEKAVIKAVKNGYTSNSWPDIKEGVEKYNFDIVYFWIIFGHDFAKAFFGEEKPLPKGSKPNTWLRVAKSRGWQYHLQQMVLEEDPILCLAKFI